MMKRMILGTKVEQSENVDFLGARPAFSGACLFVKTSSWPIQYLYRNEALLLYFLFM
jgi:hypothetical protein